MCAVCACMAVSHVYMRVRTVRTGGFTKLLKFLLRPREGQGLAQSYSTGDQRRRAFWPALLPVSSWFPFSSHSSLFLQLHDLDALSV